jgi:FkbM family methyltransferase
LTPHHSAPGVLRERTDEHFDLINFRYLRSMANRNHWMTRLKPKRLASPLASVLFPGDRRRIVGTKMGIRLYLDPLGNLGRQVLKQGVYEPDTCHILTSRLRKGDVFVDVGANEGIFCAVAGKAVGENGRVIALEPQEGLRGLIEINCRLNDISNFYIYSAGLGPPGKTSEKLFLYTALNTGMASIVKRYRSTTAAVEVRMLSLTEIMSDLGLDSIDLVKVDVEGYEGAVVEGLIELLRDGRIRMLMLDFHHAILTEQGINAKNIHQSILSTGMIPGDGEFDETKPTSYVLYEAAASASISADREGEGVRPAEPPSP